MFEGNKLKVQLAMGHEFHTKNKYLLPITFDRSLEHIFNCYVVEKLTMLIILGMQWLKNYNPQVNWTIYALTLQNSSGQ